MEIEKSAFYSQIMEISRNGNSDPAYSWVAVIIANNKEVSTYKITNIDCIRDYANNYTDEMILSVMMFAGDYVGDVYPYRDQLEVVLYKELLDGPYSSVSGSSFSQLKMTYKAVVKSTIDLKNTLMEGRPFDKAAFNLMPPLSLEFDLIRKNVMQIRAMTCTAFPFRRVVPADVVKSILTAASAAVTSDPSEVIRGVQLIEPDNNQMADHVIIPHGTPIMDVPGYVQKNCNGVYANGIGFYLQSNFWYVYAPFDVTRFKKSLRTLTIMRVPQSRFAGLDRTWSLNGDNLIVLACGEFSKTDSTTHQKLDIGVGTTYVNSSAMMDGFFKATANKVIMSAADSVNRFTVERRGDGINRAPLSRARITDNNCAEQSKLSMRQGAIMSVVWDYANPEHIEPCMPVKVITLDGEQPQEVDGVVLMSDINYRLVGKGVAAVRHACLVTLHIFYKPIS